MLDDGTRLGNYAAFIFDDRRFTQWVNLFQGRRCSARHRITSMLLDLTRLT
jgi:hypothetical protein